jgi:hypothetical protein
MLGLPSIEQVVSNFLENGTGITALRSVEWDKKYLWTVDFNGTYRPPAPFDKFFPANTVVAPFSFLESATLDLPNNTMHYPKREQQHDIQITFYDNDQRALLRWMTDWQRLDILNYGNFISGLGDTHTVVGADSFGVSNRQVWPVRPVQIGLIDANHDQVLIKNYQVYPDGEITYNGSQESGPQTFTVNFKVVKMDLANKPTQSGSALAAVKSLVGRFI